MNPLWEVIFIFLSVMAVMWGGEAVSFPIWPAAIPSVMILFYYWRVSSPQSFKNLWSPKGSVNDYILFVVAFIIFWTFIISVSMRWNPEFWIQPPIFKKFATSILLYSGNALWQQALVNGYFLPRISEGFEKRALDKGMSLADSEATGVRNAILTLGILFGLTHIPNPVLIPVTMIGGMLSAYFFKRTRNIYVLIIAHSVLAVSIMYFLPHSWHHHLRVGPGYFRCAK